MEVIEEEITLVSDNGKGKPVKFREKFRELSEVIDNILIDS